MIEPGQRKRFNVTLGNGSAHVELESFGGTISLRRPTDPRPETERKRRMDKDKEKEKEKGNEAWFMLDRLDPLAIQAEVDRAMAEAQPEIDAAVAEAMAELDGVLAGARPMPRPNPQPRPQAAPRPFSR